MIHDFSETFQIQYTLSDIFKEIAGCCRYKLLTPANLLNLFFLCEAHCIASVPYEDTRETPNSDPEFLPLNFNRFYNHLENLNSKFQGV